VRLSRAKGWWLALAAIGLTGAAHASAATIQVPAGGNLQAALVNAQPGDTVNLTPGATYTGNVTLPDKGGTSFITVQTNPKGLPGPGERISPAEAPRLAKLRSPNNMPALQTDGRAHHWRIVLVEFLANVGGEGDIVALGSGGASQNSFAGVPNNLTIDRCYIHGDPALGQKRGLALNSASTTVTGSYFSDIKAAGQDSQAIAGWNGPGPFTISNNYFEGAGENILFGGSDPAIPNLVPSDITIEHNTITKPPEWRGQSWQVKNLLELKNARRVTIRSNLFEYNWVAAQTGIAILFTVRNQDGDCPWCQVDHVTFQANIVRHSSSGISILGYDNNHPSQQTQAITIKGNVFDDIDGQKWGGNGYFMQLVGEPRDIVVDHNTVVQDHAAGILTADGGPILGFSFTNNLIRHGPYGMKGSDSGSGNDTIRAYFPASQITSNVIAEGDASLYPAGNLFPSLAQFKSQFRSFATGDYHLVTNSPWLRAGTDGTALGAISSIPTLRPVPSDGPSLPK
jgi:parallel beta helix pectate lyase-like protein